MSTRSAFGLASICCALIAAAFVYFAENPKTAKSEVSLAPRSEEEARIIKLYKESNTAVVFISTISLSYDIFSGVQPQEGTGSGVVIDAKQGIILTNFHVIENAKKVDVSLANGGTYDAKLLGIDPESDIAVLRIVDPPPDLVALSFADSSKVEIGQRVIAIGNPFGLNRTLSSGSISSLNRTIKRPDGSLMRGLIQIDAAINVGNSGGPLLDMAGRLIGITTAILSRSGDSAGIGFAVGINQINRVLPELMATGKVLRPELGWVLIDTDQGPMIHQVLTDGPAGRSNVVPVLRRVEGQFISGFIRDFSKADLIYSVDGQRVTSKEEVDDLVAQSPKPQNGIEFELRSGGLRGTPRKVKIIPEMR